MPVDILSGLPYNACSNVCEYQDANYGNSNYT